MGASEGPLVPLRHRKGVQFQNLASAGDPSQGRDDDDSCASDVSPPKQPPVEAPKKTPPPPVQEHKHFRWILCGSFVLTINAGYTNTLTIHTTYNLASAHVTGIVTKASNLLAAGHWWLLLRLVVAYVCFVSGAMTSGILINYETFYLGRSYGRVLCLIASIQGIALLVENAFDQSVVYCFLNSFAMGLQNGMTSKYSGNAVRTTHLSGASTDLGVALGHIIKGRKGEWWKVQMHGIAVVGFFIGGVIGWHAFERFEHSALLVNVVLTVLCAIIHTGYVSYHEGISVVSVLESTSDIRIHKHRHKMEDESQHASYPSNDAATARTIAQRRPRFGGSAPAGLLIQPKNHDVDDSGHSNLSLSDLRPATKSNGATSTAANPPTPTARAEEGRGSFTHIASGAWHLRPPTGNQQHDDDDEFISQSGSYTGSISYASDPGIPDLSTRQRASSLSHSLPTSSIQTTGRPCTYMDASLPINDSDIVPTPEETPLPLYDPEDPAAQAESEEDEETQSDVEMAVVQGVEREFSSEIEGSEGGKSPQRPRGNSF